MYKFVWTLAPLCLVLAMVIFGRGFCNIPVLTLIQLPISLFYCRHIRSFVLILFLYIVHAVGLSLAYLRSLDSDTQGDIDIVDHYLPVLGCSCLLALGLFIPMLLDRYLVRRWRQGLLHRIPNATTAKLAPIDSEQTNPSTAAQAEPTVPESSEPGQALAIPHAPGDNDGLENLFFPISLVSFWYVNMLSSPFSSVGHLAYAFHTWDDLMQFASFFGINGILFVLALYATTVVYIMEVIQDARVYPIVAYWIRPEAPQPPQSSASDDSDEPQPTWTPFLRSKSGRPALRPVWLAGVFFACVLIYGGARRGFQDIGFQTPIEQTQLRYANASCLISSSTDWETLYARSSRVAASSDMIMWPENALNGPIDNDTAMLEKLQGLAKNSTTVFVVTYTLRSVAANRTMNKLVLITEKGHIAFAYEKTHVVPIMEDGITAGSDYDIKTYESPKLGLVGAAICFDFDDPLFLAKAGSKGIDLMLQSSYTWGPLGRSHARVSSLRAIEQGFTLFRCCQRGTSGIYDTFGNIYAEKNMLWDDILRGSVPIKPRSITPYSVLKETLSIACLVLLVLFVLVTLLPQRWRQYVYLQVHSWREKRRITHSLSHV